VAIPFFARFKGISQSILILLALFEPSFPASHYVFRRADTSIGTLQGTVTDSNGAVVPDVNITIKNIETQFSRSAKTNAAGFFQFAAIPVGT